MTWKPGITMSVTCERSTIDNHALRLSFFAGWESIYMENVLGYPVSTSGGMTRPYKFLIVYVLLVPDLEC